MKPRRRRAVHLSWLLPVFLLIGCLVGSDRVAPLYAQTLATPLPQDAGQSMVGLIPTPIQLPDNSPITLAAYTADIYYGPHQDEQNKDTLRVVVRVRLLNNSKQEPATVTLTLGGYTNKGTPISPILAASGTDTAGATPYPHATLSRTLRPNERIWLTFVYTDTVAHAAWISYRYDVDALRAWPNPVGSVRVTFHLDPPLAHDALLSVAPHPARFNGQVLEWQWEGHTPSTAIRVLFLRASHWQRVADLRQRTRAGDARAVFELAQLLTAWLVDAPAPEAVWKTFYPEALALWSRWAREHPNDPEPWRQLARLYRERARRSDAPEAYQGLLLDALENAWKRGARDATIRVALAKATLERIEHMRQEKRWRLALDQLQHLREIVGPSGEQEVQHVRELVALDWAQDRMRVGDIAGMREALQAGWGKAILGYFRPHLPGFRYARVDVTTTEHQREIVIHALLEPEASPSPLDAWETWITATRAVLPAGAVASHKEGHRVTVTATLPFTSPEELRDWQNRLVDAMPDLPEWSPLRDALTPRPLVYRRDLHIWGERRAWEERVSLLSARQNIDNVLSTLQVSAFTPLPPDVPQALMQVRRILRDRDVKAWQDMRDSFRAVYTLRWQGEWGAPASARVVLQLGQENVLRLRQTRYAPYRIALLGVGILLGWTVLTLGLWYVGTRE